MKCRQLSTHGYQLLCNYCANVNLSAFFPQLCQILVHHTDKDRLRCVTLKWCSEHMERLAVDASGCMIRYVLSGLSKHYLL